MTREKSTLEEGFLSEAAVALENCFVNLPKLSGERSRLRAGVSDSSSRIFSSGLKIYLEEVYFRRAMLTFLLKVSARALFYDTNG